MWRDSERVEEAAELMKMTANELLKNGVADRMFPEHKDGIENNLNYTTDQIREALRKKLPEHLRKILLKIRLHPAAVRKKKQKHYLMRDIKDLENSGNM